jgi:hypothetical protein
VRLSFKESRIRFISANKLHRKSGWRSGRTAGKNGPPSLNLSLQLPESGRVLSRIFVRHNDCEPPIGSIQNTVPSGHIARLDFLSRKSIFAEARAGIPILILP